MNHTALSLHPDNPHYFLFRGKPTFLITSGEHYASVLNLEFDYRKYLDTLHQEGLNHTRLFVGVYRELPDDWWSQNPLAPRPGQFACPFGRSSVAGERDGGNKFDLDTWDAVFFQRLHDFCHLASERGIVIEVNLFCPYYAVPISDKYWLLSPWHADNNVNGVGGMPPTEVFTLKHPRLLQYQEAMVKEIVGEVNSYDNLYFEICNEPYFDDVSLEWQEHIAEVIQEEERRLPLRHLISQNVANVWPEIKEAHAAFSIFNFHYPRPDPKCVTDNYHLNKVIGCNETGFDGREDEPYRIQAWQFMLAGGGLFNHLDASFCAGDEAGSHLEASIEKFGGGPGLRRQLGILKEFLESFDFVHMTPEPSITAERGGAEAIYVLSETGKQYGAYILCAQDRTCRAITVQVPDGFYTAETINVITGEISQPKTVIAANGILRPELPEFQRDIAMRIMAK